MNTIIKIAAALGFASVLLPASVQAADEEAGRQGFYLGASAGQADITDDPQGTGGQEVSGNSTAYNLFGGYRWQLGRFFDLAGELAYTDLGTVDGNAGATPYQYKTQGFGASVLAILPISIFDFYGRLGVAQVNVDKTINNVATSSDGTAGVYGVGVGLRFGHLGFRLEYDSVDVPDVKSTEVGMLSVYWQF